MWLAVGFIIIGIIAIFIEFFVPAGGIIGVIGLALIITGIVFGYNAGGAVYGSILLISCIVLSPVILFTAVKLIPRSPLARLIVLESRQDKEQGFEDYNQDKNLLGREGESLTILRPAGLARIDGIKYNVISESEFIEKGLKIKVIDIEGKKIIVKKI